jgi:EF hand/EF-hand domain pair
MPTSKSASLSLVAAIALFMIAPLPCFAAKAAPDMTALDPDHDGTVSLEEAQKAGAAKFDVLDADHDGTLDKKELKGVLGKPAFKKADPDNDGTIDKTEYSAEIDAAFKKADVNGDGTLDTKELSSGPGRRLLKLIQ